MYTHTTYLQFQSLVADRLGDTIFYTSTEIKRYCIEALRTWNALAQFSMERGTFNTTDFQVFYDLPSTLKNGSTYILGYNVYDQDIFTDLKYSLIEDASTSDSWTGTSQFTLQQCQDAIEKARNEFLLRTSLIVQHSTMNLPSPPIERFDLDDSVIDVKRVSFKSNSGATYYTPLKRTDELTSTGWLPSWYQSPERSQAIMPNPSAFSVYLTPKVQVGLIPIALTGGVVSLVTLNTSTPLDLSSGVLLNIPDDFSWAIKWKALFYLLSKDGEATDSFRAAYCQSRFEEAILAAKISSTVQQGFINGSLAILSSIDGQDNWNSSWEQVTGTGAPSSLIIAGRNLLALAPPPKRDVSIMLDVVRNFPIPILNGDYVQVGREHLSALVDYATHVAMFKVGGSEFQATLPLRDNLFQLALENNQHLKAIAKDFELLKKQSFKPEIEVPMYAKVGEGVSQNA